MNSTKALAVAAIWLGIGMCGIGAGIHGGDGTAFVGLFFIAVCGAVATSYVRDM